MARSMKDVKTPLSNTVIDEMEKVKYSEVDDEIKAKCTCCNVCLDDYSPDDEVLKLKCEHIYHADCISGWFKEKKSCPICRKDQEDI